jgi:hypothetical protein
VYSNAIPVVADQTASPLWVEIPAAVNSIIAAAALIVAGCFAYMRFVRGRVLHAACRLKLSTKLLVMADDVRAMVITAIVQNAGSLRLIFPLPLVQSVTIYRADTAIWADAIEWGDVLWTEGLYRKRDILTIEGVEQADYSLEPGESIRRDLLVPLPSDPCMAYRVAMHVEACPQLMWRTRPAQTWETEVVFVGGEPDG